MKSNNKNLRLPIVLSGLEELSFLSWFCKNNNYVLDRLVVITETARTEYPQALLPMEML